MMMMIARRDETRQEGDQVRANQMRQKESCRDEKSCKMIHTGVLEVILML